MTCQEAMAQASLCVLEQFPLRTEAKVIRFPDRYMDPRGRATWNAVHEGLAGGLASAA